ncbi:MAG: hypothetical protein D6826_00130 [Alphaproteobacteria bacterium]|nr:MAG: hypothetical protein D6826_00130 [Alphaproteobacteria bacterium]
MQPYSSDPQNDPLPAPPDSVPDRATGPAPASAFSSPPLDIDLDRVVWDPEYRDEVRAALRDTDGGADSI